MTKPFTGIAVLVLLVAAAAHVYRLVKPFDIIVDGMLVPPWASVAGAAIALFLALMVLRESRR